MDKYFLLTFMPPNPKSVYFRAGTGYKSGTQWVFQNFVPPSLNSCPHIEVKEISEEEAFIYIDKGVIYNDYIQNEKVFVSNAKSSSVDHFGIIAEDDNQLIEQIRKVVADEVSQISHASDSSSDDSFNDEMSLAEIQNKIFNRGSNDLEKSKSSFGKREEQSSDSSLDDNAQLLKGTKGPIDNSMPNQLDSIKIEKVDDDHFVSDEDEGHKRLNKSEKNENILDIIEGRGGNNSRKDRILNMLDDLRE